MFTLDYLTIFKNTPPELVTFLVAMLPIAELRGAIPVGLVGFDLPIWVVYIIAVTGNLIPAFFLLLYLHPVAKWLSSRSKFFDRFFSWLFKRTRHRFSARAEKYGVFISLVTFVAIPLPITGAWTGSVAAYLFGIPFKRAMAAVTIGVLIAGLIVTVTTVGLSAIF